MCTKKQLLILMGDAWDSYLQCKFVSSTNQQMTAFMTDLNPICHAYSKGFLFKYYMSILGGSLMLYLFRWGGGPEFGKT